MTSHPIAVLMAGPTASGKSALALELARQLDAVIVNADSMQVYRDLQILTARPGAPETSICEHVLYGFVDGAETFSTGRWIAEISQVLAALARDNRLAIITGGTGLYFKALTAGLAPVPDTPEAIRAKWRERLRQAGAGSLFAELEQVDPDMAEQLEPSDGQRIARALEVMEATDKSLDYWRDQPAEPALSGWRYVNLVIAPEREALYARCDSRFDQMIEQGALDEARALAARKLDPGLPVMKALGVPELIAVNDGTLEIERAREVIKRDTRRYAKRQMTWFRNQLAGWPQIAPSRAVKHVLDAVSALKAKT
jgi:tRNA dimethylallyltransferase